jgi:hypothetical protein
MAAIKEKFFPATRGVQSLSGKPGEAACSSIFVLVESEGLKKIRI